MARAKKEKKPKKEKSGKGGKKKLLLPLLGLVVIAAAAVIVVKVVLPRLGGGEDKSSAKGLEAYTIGEDTVASLDTVLEEGEGELMANRGPGKRKETNEDTGEEKVVEKYTYVYEVIGAAAIMDRYLDVLLGDAGFSLVDETYLVQEDRPELSDAEGALLLARPSVVEGSLFQLAIGWSDVSDTLAVRVAVPEGKLRYPEKNNNNEPQPASLSEQMDSLRTMSPSRLALSGSSMSEYDVYPVQGFVTIDGQLCRRFNIYEVGESNNIAGIIFYSGDMQRIYRMDTQDNSIITELKY